MVKSVDVGVGIIAEVKLLHEGKQSELMHTNERLGPFLSLFWEPGVAIGLGGEGVMKVRNGGHGPGAAGHGTREKTACVVDKVGDNHFKDIWGKSIGGR